ncbi:alpha/beta hydrolase family protein [Muriicola sp. SD30]|uniref:alpha/beta hydrolase family protein n=1 Tax=Muriicola sp. SD30 TaxID=3240936 RepID=UPI00350F4977
MRTSFNKRKTGILATLVAVLASMALSYGQSPCDTLYFDSHGYEIRGYFYKSGTPASPTLIFSQGFMETGDIWNIGKTLSAKGINVFTFDFRGCFESGGKQSLSNSLEDIGAALSFIKSDDLAAKYPLDTTRLVVGGYSFGGHMSMIQAVNDPSIKRVISISGGDLGIFAQQLDASQDLQIAYSGYFREIEKPDGPVDFEFEVPIKELLLNREHFDIYNQSAKLADVDILMVGGLDDSTVSMEDHILPLYRQLKKNKSQNIRCLIYQTNHSYKNVSGQLMHDLYDWIMYSKSR